MDARAEVGAAIPGDVGVLQGQGAAAVVVDIVVVCAGLGQGAVGVGRPVAAVQHIGAAHGEGGGIARPCLSGTE